MAEDNGTQQETNQEPNQEPAQQEPEQQVPSYEDISKQLQELAQAQTQLMGMVTSMQQAQANMVLNGATIIDNEPAPAEPPAIAERFEDMDFSV